MKALCLIALAACAHDAKLDARVAALESRPAHAADPETTRALHLAEQRVAELQTKVDAQQQRIADLEAVVHELGDQVADALAAQAPVPVPVPAPPDPSALPPGPPHGQLDPKKVYSVPLDDSPQFGKADAAVTLVAAIQFPEPYTHRAWPVLKQLQAQYGAQLRLVIKSYVVHPQATESTIAACAVARQGQARLDRYEQELYDKVMTTGARVWLDAAGARDLAKSEGVDLAKLDRDLKPCRATQGKDQTTFRRLGQTATPTFWIDGRPLSGAQPIAQFQQMIDEEIKKQAADKASGNRPATFYQRVVVTAGAPTGP